MIFTFRLVSDEVANFKREIKIDSTATFLDLKKAICDSVGYDKAQLSSFFICDHNWEKKKEITFEDMGVDDDEDVLIMDECELGDYIFDEGQKLLYVFDYMTDRVFFVEMSQSEPGKSLKDPFCSLSIGKAPQEVMELKDFEEKTTKTETPSDMDEEFYGSDDFNQDEFDSEGFEELPFDEN